MYCVFNECFIFLTALTVQHFLTLSPTEPWITWLNSSVPSAIVTYDYDGLCTITLTQNPTNKFTVSQTNTATQLSVTITKKAATADGVYQIILSSNRLGRSFQGATREVFIGEDIRNLQVLFKQTHKHLTQLITQLKNTQRMMYWFKLY